MSSPGSLSNRGGYVGVIWSLFLSWFTKEARLCTVLLFFVPCARILLNHNSSSNLNSMAYFGCIWWSIRGARSNGIPPLLWNKAPEEVAQLGEGLWCRLACIYVAGQRPRNAQTGWRNSPKCLCSARRHEPGFVSLLSPAAHFCCPIRVALAEIHSLAQEEASAFPP